MERLVISCPQPGEEAYVAMFNTWCTEMDKRYEIGREWLHDHDACLSSKKIALRTTLNNMMTFRDEFTLNTGGWVDSLSVWLASAKTWLADLTIVIADGGGDTTMTTDWQTWLGDMEDWIQAVKDWCDSVKDILDQMIKTWSDACDNWEQANDSWTTAMADWIDSWPKGVPPA